MNINYYIFFIYFIFSNNYCKSNKELCKDIKIGKTRNINRKTSQFTLCSTTILFYFFKKKDF